ncbi:unnamed protein product [Blepharisma stoltei]|uniref:histidine kinase n=1 Tax=Blepharisma stoltei TaxID=1481888 RepID=A0AAU9K6E5_9CILI|nr:unnamed protein product [Blepharisma stoltei]
MHRKLSKKWWAEEVNEKYSILRFFVYRNINICIFLLLIFALCAPNSLNLLVQALPIMIFQILFCFLVNYFDTKDENKKALFAIIYSESCCIGLFWLSYNHLKDHVILCEMFYAILMMAFEIPLIQTHWVRYAVTIKHAFMWHYINYFNGNITFDYSITPHIPTVLCLFMYNHMTNMRSEISYERFLNREGKSKVKRRLSIIVNAFPDGIFILSENLEIVYTNDNLLSLLHCDDQHLMEVISSITYYEGKKYSNFSNSNLLIEDLKEIFNQNISNGFMLGISLYGGNNYEWKGQKIIWEDQHAIAIIVRDANHIIQLEQSISDSKVKTVILRSVSHELRTPINAIAFLVEELLEKKNENWTEGEEEKLRIISISTKLLLTLVNDLLDYSRMLAGAFSIRKCEFNLRSAIKNAWELIKLQAVKKNLKLTLRIDPSLPVNIYSDQLRFSQVLLNLLSNALKFTLHGSIEVTFVLSLMNQLKITVQDTGIGIDSDKKNRLFQEFSSDGLPTINPHGCGLGLHISNKIAKELGGSSIKVKSQVGQGSAFSFDIDIFDHNSSLIAESLDYGTYMDENPDLGIPFSLPLISHKSESHQVLIVDDNDFNRVILASLLMKNGIPTLEACTGKQAVDLILKNSTKEKIPIKVIVMDGEMPEMNGWDATKKIHEMYFKKEIKFLPSIIGYTAYNTDEDISNCFKCGMQECLIKPCAADKILATIIKFL